MKKIHLFTLLFSMIVVTTKAVEVATSSVYSVAEITFTGPSQTQNDPNLDFWVTFTHESGSPSYKVWGFYDGNGTGGNSGNVFKVRFCPTKAGKWNLQDVYSTSGVLNNQKEGDYVTATASSNHGFWEVEKASGSGHWFKRNDGTHQFLFGNTMYDFLNFRTTSGVTSDVNLNADYYKKLRFMIDGREGYYTTEPSEGVYPKVGFYNVKADLAIRTALAKDMIMDLILYKTLYKANGEAYVKYIAARYGSYPNVWFCLANEWDIKDPLSTSQVQTMGQQIRKYIPYNNPLTIHPNTGTGWNTAINTSPAWNDHKVTQYKVKDLSDAAIDIVTNYNRTPTGMPVVDDENGYEGAGDGYNEGDIVEGLLGSFSAGGYGSTAYKPAKGLGQYYKGNFSPTEHSSSDNLKWLSDAITANIEFWKLVPVSNASSIFPAASTEFKVLQETGKQYLICTDASGTVSVNLPTGTWNLKQFNAISKTTTSVNNLTGTYSLAVPNSRACINYFYLTNVSSSPVITAPLGSTTFSPGQSVTATATGLNLSWVISIVGGSTFATGTGQSITFQIPTNAANNAQLKIQLTGGTASNEVVSQLNTIIDDSPVIQSITQTAVANTAFSIQLTATGTGTPMTWAATTLPAGTTLTTDGLLQGTITTSGTKSLTVTVTDVDGDTNTQTLTLQVLDASQPFCEAGGIVTVECENYTSNNINGDIIGWGKFTSATGYAGSGYMSTDINNYANGIWIEAADLSYDITFNTTGNYYMWIYRYAPTGSSNSAYVGMNGTAVGSTFDNGSGSGWGWVKHATPFNVSTAGMKTINIRRREQGMGVDKFILTTNASYIPSGNAQVESAKCGASNPTGTTLTATEDAYVRNGTYASTNYGSDIELQSKNNGSVDDGYTRQAYLKFDLSSISGTISSVKLRLYGKLGDVSNTNIVSSIYSVATTSWTESTINWNNKPTTGTTALASVTVANTTPTWYEIDVTTYVKNEKTAGRNVVALVVKNPNVSTTNSSFASTEASTNKPSLVVTTTSGFAANAIANGPNSNKTELSNDLQETTSLYPIPAKDKAFFKFEATNAQKVSVKLYNESGQLVSNNSYSVITGSNEIAIALTGLPDGIYYLSAVIDSKVINKKLVVVN